MSALLITGCGFKLRSGDNIPSPLHTLYFHTNNRYDELNVAVGEALQSLGIHLATQPSQARYGLYISNKKTKQLPNSIIDASQQTQVSFTLHTTAVLSERKTSGCNNKKALDHNCGYKELARQSFSTTGSMTVNANQGHTATLNSSIQSHMQQDIIADIYAWLSSKHIKAELNLTKSNTYANQHQTTLSHPQ
jgi:outer membrane lipopolysaccharide assembly protein LptE/RlpB